MIIEKHFDYHWDEGLGMICITGLSDFDLKQTLECGQCFRWTREKDGSYTGVALSRVINVSQDEAGVYIKNTTLQDFADLWIDYFDLYRDYGKIKMVLGAGDPIMEKAISYGSGIRLLKQDEWEILISFLISQNSNIPRIRKCIDSICRSFGQPIQTYKGELYYAFPTPLSLADCTKDEIGCCRLGYRETYIVKTAKRVLLDEARNLYNAKNLTRNEAEKYLLSLSGVGPKVANCILLFAMGFYESFPIDVWMKRVMNQLYGYNEKHTGAMTHFAADQFGELSGFAQQYLFYYVREKSEE